MRRKMERARRLLCSSLLALWHNLKVLIDCRIVSERVGMVLLFLVVGNWARLCLTVCSVKGRHVVSLV